MAAAPRPAPQTTIAPAPAPIAAAAAPSVAAPAAAAPATRLAPFGYNENGPAWGTVALDAAARMAAETGATLHRFEFNWRFAEPTPGSWRLDRYDAIYEADLARGIRPVFILMYAPEWAWPEGATCDVPTDCRFPPGAAHMDAWRGVVRMLVRRYPEMAALEIWNEPNLTAFWRPGPDPARYTDLLVQASSAARDAGSAVPVLGGSLAGFPQSVPGTAISYRAFLSAMYASGARGAMDGISLHPYPGGMNLARTQRMLTEIRDVRDAQGDDVPLWVTEIGATTTPGGGWVATEDEQARIDAALVQRLRAQPDVAAVLVHTLVEPIWSTASGPQRGFGLVRPDGTPKPAFCALAATLGPRPVCPTPSADPQLDARLQGQDLLQAAVDAARAYRRMRGGFAGLSPAVLSSLDPVLSDRPADGSLLPGPDADPARIGVWVWTDAQGEELLICNTSTADRSYCAEALQGRGWAYGHAAGTVYAAAGATTRGTSTSW